jgi:hypothetical protein
LELGDVDVVFLGDLADEGRGFGAAAVVEGGFFGCR